MDLENPQGFIPLVAYGFDDGLMDWFRYNIGPGPVAPTGDKCWTMNVNPSILIDSNGAIEDSLDEFVPQYSIGTPFTSSPEWLFSYADDAFYAVQDINQLALIQKITNDGVDYDNSAIPYRGDIGGAAGIVSADQLYIVDHAGNGFDGIPTATAYNDGTTMNVGQTGFTNFDSFDINPSRTVALGYAGGTGGYGVFAAQWGDAPEDRIRTGLPEGRARITSGGTIVGRGSISTMLASLSLPPWTFDDRVYLYVGNHTRVRTFVFTNRIVCVANNEFHQNNFPSYQQRGNTLHCFDESGSLLWSFVANDYSNPTTDRNEIASRDVYEFGPGGDIVFYTKQFGADGSIHRMFRLDRDTGSVVWKVKWKDGTIFPGGFDFTWMKPNVAAGQILFSQTSGYPGAVPIQDIITEAF